MSVLDFYHQIPSGCRHIIVTHSYSIVKIPSDNDQTIVKLRSNRVYAYLYLGLIIKNIAMESGYRIDKFDLG
jgi:hypothetical protein